MEFVVPSLVHLLLLSVFSSFFFFFFQLFFFLPPLLFRPTSYFSFFVLFLFLPSISTGFPCTSVSVAPEPPMPGLDRSQARGAGDSTVAAMMRGDAPRRFVGCGERWRAPDLRAMGPGQRRAGKFWMHSHITPRMVRPCWTEMIDSDIRHHFQYGLIVWIIGNEYLFDTPFSCGQW